METLEHHDDINAAADLLDRPVYAPDEYRSPRLKAKIATAGLLLYGVGLAIALWVGFVCHQITGQAARGEDVSLDTASRMLERANWLNHIAWVLLAVAAIAFCFWFHRVARNAIAFKGPLSFTPGMGVAGFFIPIISLYRPYMSIREIWRVSDGDIRRPTMLTEMPGPPFWILAWWLSWIGSRLILQFLGTSGDSISSPSVAHDVMTWFLVGGALEAVALVLAICVVWGVTRRQERAAAHLMPSARAVKIG